MIIFTQEQYDLLLEAQEILQKDTQQLMREESRALVEYLIMICIEMEEQLRRTGIVRLPAFTAPQRFEGDTDDPTRRREFIEWCQGLIDFFGGKVVLKD